MLNRQVYVSDNEFIICPIVDEDRDNYVELHRQISGEHTLFLNEHCKDMMLSLIHISEPTRPY